MLKFLLALYVSSALIGFFVTFDFMKTSLGRVREDLIEKYPDAIQDVTSFLDNNREFSLPTTLLICFQTALCPIVNAFLIIIYIVNAELYIDKLKTTTQESIEEDLLKFLSISHKIRELEENNGN